MMQLRNIFSVSVGNKNVVHQHTIFAPHKEQIVEGDIWCCCVELRQTMRQTVDYLGKLGEFRCTKSL